MTDVSLDARVTELEENGGGSGSNGIYVLSDCPLQIPIFILTVFFSNKIKRLHTKYNCGM